MKPAPVPDPRLRRQLTAGRLLLHRLMAPAGGVLSALAAAEGRADALCPILGDAAFSPFAVLEGRGPAASDRGDDRAPRVGPGRAQLPAALPGGGRAAPSPIRPGRLEGRTPEPADLRTGRSPRRPSPETAPIATTPAQWPPTDPDGRPASRPTATVPAPGLPTPDLPGSARLIRGDPPAGGGTPGGLAGILDQIQGQLGQTDRPAPAGPRPGADARTVPSSPTVIEPPASRPAIDAPSSADPRPAVASARRGVGILDTRANGSAPGADLTGTSRVGTSALDAAAAAHIRGAAIPLPAGRPTARTAFPGPAERSDGDWAIDVLARIGDLSGRLLRAGARARTDAPSSPRPTAMTEPGSPPTIWTAGPGGPPQSTDPAASSTGSPLADPAQGPVPAARLDPDALADLVNLALLEQANRHGVDLG